MNHPLGFTLTEVLIALLLMTTTSLALVNQQWQMTQLFNQSHQLMKAQFNAED
jgi:prepilin-type N-terminal cleavage/methylation domain-containing protein